MMRTLNNLSDLRESRFGQPPPRHGLNLLWWFVHACVKFDSNSRMIALCNPENGAYGFHRFYNKERLLPYTDLPYYEVGNLHITDSLPEYVTEDDTGYSDDDSNTDRIIVSFNSGLKRFDRIYVTQHLGQLNFDQNHTYRISIKLMKDIKDLRRQEFLKKSTLPNPPVNLSEHVSIDMFNGDYVEEIQPVQSETCLSKNCSCCVLILLLLIVAVIVYFSLSK